MGGAQARDTRHRGRNPHRAAGIGAERGVRHLGRDQGAGAAAGAPGNALRVPRIAALAEHRVGRDHTPGELLHVGLADQYRALGLEPPDHGSVAVGDVVGEVGGAAGGAHACRLDVVLERDGHAVQEAEPAPLGGRPVAGIGLFPRPLRRGRRHGVEHGIELLDPREAALDRRPCSAGQRPVGHPSAHAPARPTNRHRLRCCGWRSRRRH